MGEVREKDRSENIRDDKGESEQDHPEGIPEHPSPANCAAHGQVLPKEIVGFRREIHIATSWTLLP